MSSGKRLSVAFLCFLGLLLFSQTRRVVGEDMDPSIQDGDLIVFLPAFHVIPGDVVLLNDPMDTDRTLLRRVMAVSGQTITVADGHLKVGKRRLRAAAMGDMESFLIIKETLWAKKPDVGSSWLTRHQAEPNTHFKAAPVPIPEGQVYLMADDRDGPLDSRWWGPVGIEQIKGVARIRFGKAHTWRPSWELLAGTAPLGA